MTASTATDIQLDTVTLFANSIAYGTKNGAALTLTVSKMELPTYGSTTK